jgi:hypothetical protein
MRFGDHMRIGRNNARRRLLRVRFATMLAPIAPSAPSPAAAFAMLAVLLPSLLVTLRLLLRLLRNHFGLLAFLV